MGATVIDVLRRFLPHYLATRPALHEAQRRAVWAIEHCRTPAMGGHLYTCGDCKEQQFAYHSCNHRNCPQCGRAATAEWVARELGKQIATPYFMVTFTLPEELRGLFCREGAKRAFDHFFAASSQSLRDTLASPRWLGAETCGFTGVLHTWNQRLHTHPHIHYTVPGGGLDPGGDFVQVKSDKFLVPVPVVSKAFRRHFRDRVEKEEWEVDPAVWGKDWGVHIQPFGDGNNAIKYLGAYVSRSVIGDSRIVAIRGDRVTFRWKDRSANGAIRNETVAGTEFVRRYLRHVLPRGLRSIRYFGFCHPAAKAKRERIAFHSGKTLRIGEPSAPLPDLEKPALRTPSCPCCERPMRRGPRLPPLRRPRPPPTTGT